MHPHGAFLVVRRAGEPLGCGAVRVLEPGVAEIKHMWLSPHLRGSGVGRRLLGTLEAVARDLGCPLVKLETSPFPPEALALYRSAGYVDAAPYCDGQVCAIFLERRPG